MPASPEGRLVVVSGPSGVGKSTIVAAVMKELGAEFSVSATTRRPRPHEVDGVDYHFVDRTTFEEMRAQGDILEWAEYGGNLYGTPLSSVRPIVERGVDVILDIENEGARQIRAAYDGAVLIFILPPSLTELERRLRGRGDTSTEDMERRLSVAEAQIAEAEDLYDHLVVNDDLDTAIADVVDILRRPATPDHHVPDPPATGAEPT